MSTVNIAQNTETPYRDALIEKGFSPEDAAAIAAKTRTPSSSRELAKTEHSTEVIIPAIKDAPPKKKSLGRSGENKTKAIINAAVEIATNPVQVDETGNMAWGAKCLVAASLPYREPKPEQLQNGAWVRRNGNYTLWIQGGPEGLPYGAHPRVFIIWLTTEAVRTQSRNIETGGSFSAFCRKMQIDTSRGKRGSGRLFIQQVDKLLSSRTAFVTGSFDEGRVRKEFLQFTDDFELFFDLGNPSQASIFESEIVLTEKFYHEITTHSIPLDIRAVSALRQSPLELDIYQWLAYRMYGLKSPARPTWQQLFAQFGAGHSQIQRYCSLGFYE